ncbi:MAG TPA: hypothetical protein VIS07_19960 [Candidatus Binatia bacterium]
MTPMPEPRPDTLTTLSGSGATPPTHEQRRARGAIAPRVRVAGALTVAALLGTLAAEAAAQERVSLEVGTVLATNSREHFDAQLAGMRDQLQRLFRYSSYELVKQEQSDVSCGKPATFDIPGGRRLRVMPKQARGGRVSLNLALMKDSHVLMNTDLTLGKRGLIMVGGPRYENGTLIIWIGARRMPDASAVPPALEVQGPAAAATQQAGPQPAGAVTESVE